jgi:hypothetical protein
MECEEMINAIVEWWNTNAIGEKVYTAYAIIIGIFVISGIVRNIWDNPKHRIRFIEKAQNKNCSAVAKMTCLTLHGVNEPSHYVAEYMYFVNDKRYFVTYQIGCGLLVDDRVECMNADMLLHKIKNAIVVFYDEKNPKKTMTKQEVFTSYDCIHKIKTPKKNVWRDTEKVWDSAIDLVQ